MILIKSKFNIPGYKQMITLLFIQNKTGQNDIIDEISNVTSLVSSQCNVSSIHVLHVIIHST